MIVILYRQTGKSRIRPQGYIRVVDVEVFMSLIMRLVLCIALGRWRGASIKPAHVLPQRALLRSYEEDYKQGPFTVSSTHQQDGYFGPFLF